MIVRSSTMVRYKFDHYGYIDVMRQHFAQACLKKLIRDWMSKFQINPRISGLSYIRENDLPVIDPWLWCKWMPTGTVEHWGSVGGPVMRTLSFHQWGPGSNPVVDAIYVDKRTTARARAFLDQISWYKKISEPHLRNHSLQWKATHIENSNSLYAIDACTTTTYWIAVIV